jgi:GNAT superfamily N-acetyltransferase
LSGEKSRVTNLNEVKIRAARTDDADGLARLAGDLGHPTTPEQVATRFSAASQQNTYALIDAEPRVDVAGLVVSEALQGRGIGRTLMDHAEKWAAERGCRIVHLRSNLKRAGAHAFYERLGYEHFKTQKAFRKILK